MKDWIALNMTPGVGPRVTARLLEHFGSAEAIFDAPRRELALARLPPETVESIVAREFHPRAEAEVGRVRQLGGDILVLDDGVYPALLRAAGGLGREGRLG
jgi:DNA processing protein